MNGQIFIVTKGRENVRLGLVEVRALLANEAISHVRSRKASVDSLLLSVQPLVNKAHAALESARSELADAPRLAVAQEIRYIKGEIGRDQYVDRSEFLARAARRVEDAERRASKVDSLVEAARSGPLFLENLPQGCATARSDADGRFALDVPRGKRIAIAAQADRQTPMGVESYCWLLWLPDEARRGKPLYLSNHNLTTAKPTGSLLELN